MNTNRIMSNKDRKELVDIIKNYEGFGAFSTEYYTHCIIKLTIDTREILKQIGNQS